MNFQRAVSYVECGLTKESSLKAKCMLPYSDFWKTGNSWVKDRITFSCLRCGSSGKLSRPQIFILTLCLLSGSPVTILKHYQT